MTSDEKRAYLVKIFKINPSHFLRPRERHLTSVQYSINERARLLARLDKVTENGKICMVVEGMDCDCMQSCTARTRERESLFEEWRREEREYENAEGPTWVSFCRPSEAPSNARRDRALEAFEGGHPHSVYMGSLD